MVALVGEWRGRGWAPGWRDGLAAPAERLQGLDRVGPLGGQRDPVLPILDQLVGLLVHRDALQLGQGNRKGSAFPADQDEHLVLALRFGAIATTSTWSPRRSGEMLRWAMHLATKGKCRRSSREEYQPMACSSGV
jgi:hypothetical protein